MARLALKNFLFYLWVFCCRPWSSGDACSQPINKAYRGEVQNQCQQMRRTCIGCIKAHKKAEGVVSGTSEMQNKWRFGEAQGEPSPDRDRVARLAIHCIFCSHVQLQGSFILNCFTFSYLSVCSWTSNNVYQEINIQYDNISDWPSNGFGI